MESGGPAMKLPAGIHTLLSFLDDGVSAGDVRALQEVSSVATKITNQRIGFTEKRCWVFKTWQEITRSRLFIGRWQTAFDHERDVFIGVRVSDFDIRTFIPEHAEHLVDKALPHCFDIFEIQNNLTEFIQA